MIKRFLMVFVLAALLVGSAGTALRTETHEAKAYSVFTCQAFGDRDLLAQPPGTFNLLRWSCQRTYAAYGIPFPY